MTYRVEFTPEAVDHLARLRAHERARVLDAVGRHLAHSPTGETRNRKPLRPNPVAEYRLRVGPLRVYYDVRPRPALLVLIKAVGVKVRDRVYVGGEEIKL